VSISLIVADDHPLILEALERLFQDEKEFKVLATCRNGEETLVALKKHKPDLAVIDLRMPGKNGLAVLREMKQDNLSTRAVLLTAELNESELTEAVQLGARGLVLKELATELLIQCLRDVHAGKLWLEKRSVGSALEKLLRGAAGKLEATERLTPREIEIVKLVAIGLRNAEVAKRLFISEGTVKMHLHNIYGKLDLDSRIKLSCYAQQKALV
jgi:DNA-binding NarL/FixJ family response regulator